MKLNKWALNRNGFSLIEMMISIVILFSSFNFVMTVQSKNAQSSDQSIDLWVAQQNLESLASTFLSFTAVELYSVLEDVYTTGGYTDDNFIPTNLNDPPKFSQEMFGQKQHRAWFQNIEGSRRIQNTNFYVYFVDSSGVIQTDWAVVGPDLKNGNNTYARVVKLETDIVLANGPKRISTTRWF
jgi:type II secretory pathway pseudopilin PulG